MALLRGMDFARNQLLKYGWKEGKGLGRNESGISKALKPKLKFDNQGIGHDAAEQFTYHWWEDAFNQAANNIKIATTENGVAVELEDENLEITTKKYSMRAFKKPSSLEYGTFLKTSTLTQDGRMKRIAQTEPEVIEEKNSDILTDDDLFRICGGRTAHKGARHGLKLNGKLARIEAQEKQLLAQINEKKKKEDNLEQSTKKCRTSKFEMENEDSGSINSVLHNLDHRIKKKKKSKKLLDEYKVSVSEVPFEDSEIDIQTFSTHTKKKKKSASHNGDKDEAQDPVELRQDNFPCVVLKRSKHSKRKCEKNDEEENDSKKVCKDESDDSFQEKKKKSKK